MGLSTATKQKKQWIFFPQMQGLRRRPVLPPLLRRMPLRVRPEAQAGALQEEEAGRAQLQIIALYLLTSQKLDALLIPSLCLSISAETCPSICAFIKEAGPLYYI